MSATTWRRLRVAAGVAILALLGWRVGTAPVLDGLRTVDAQALLLATLLAVPTTVCSAWRWRLVARGLGVELPLAQAVAQYYRSTFLNTVLPGGVLGDIHRGLRHGQDTGNATRGLKAVVGERVAGQVVQIAVTVVVLVVLPSPVHLPWVALPVLAVLLVVALHVGSRLLPGTSAGVGPGVLVASAVVVTGHVALFLLAARTAGVVAPVTALLPLALLVLLAMAVPANVAGWGPREGVAAWAFAAAGLGAPAGLSTAVVYGVLTFAAELPGAVVLVVLWWRRPERPTTPAPPPERVHASRSLR